ncbi:hypothetical protein ACPOLB_27155 [Rubrivivax sp. RP6-9]|uniref:hypothetical protein n=1 Tax=Rubrivivax sp. RP6-9 TaxID=3415750 RepID=UPI003CC6D981
MSTTGKQPSASQWLAFFMRLPLQLKVVAVSLIAFAAMVVFALFLAAKGRYVPPPTNIAPNAGYAQNARELCAHAKFSACFVSADGRTCQSELGTPIGRLMGNGNYSVIGAEVESSERCLLTVRVQGTIDGTSYAKTGQVWAWR